MKKFSELFRYVKDKKVNIECPLSVLPQSFKDRIEFDEPQTLYEVI